MSTTTKPKPAKKAAAAKPAPAKKAPAKKATPAKVAVKKTPATKPAPANKTAAKPAAKTAAKPPAATAAAVPLTAGEVPYPSIVLSDNVRHGLGDSVLLDELAASISELGLLEPLVVAPADLDAKGNPTYRLTAGARRHEAIRRLIARGDWPTKRPVPVMIENDHPDEATRILRQLVENLHRDQLNPVDEARGYLRLTSEFGMKQNQLAGRVARSTAHVSQRLALLRLPQATLTNVAGGRIPIDTAVRLAKCDEAVVEQLTAGGRVPTIAEIEAAENRRKSAELARQFTDRLGELGVTVAATAQPVVGYKSFGNITKLAELDKLTSEIVAGETRAKIHEYPTYGTVEAWLYKPNTQPATPAATDDASGDEGDLSDDEKAWRAYQAECDRIRTNHTAAQIEARKLEHTYRRTWATTQDAKNVARWSMMALAADFSSSWSSPVVAEMLGLTDTNLSYVDADRLLADYASTSAQNLVTLTACILLAEAIDHTGEGEEPDGINMPGWAIEINESWRATLGDATFDVPTPTYPPRPDQAATDAP